ncbi:transposase [Streptomyces sp. NPDC058240]|uniref:transposase n=1 Tax=Streptomyces sp. NPDC058240 TaxID=3346396 RepID=UPI0036E566CD
MARPSKYSAEFRSDAIALWRASAGRRTFKDVAADLNVNWSHQGRFRSEAAFASFAGVSPIPASSGLTNRHRLDRSEDRQLNRALHTITLIRMRLGPRHEGVRRSEDH